ncbi:MAG TPA: dNTP triphosphohydrolase [Bryobacteraceae bacterium]|jgi:dGTPase|nr:dNTP triphosphohydrolase [Bryobacteraceae bacterium]
MLSHLRFPAGQSRGRRYPEPEHGYRNPFQRDRDRIIYSRPFRRLENKTQVFAPDISDHFRNRLTHTIEVAEIARTVAGVLELNEDFTEALALVHDVGHPPFAHSGEEALDSEMRRYGGSFNHNLHALRLVEAIESRYPRFPGLNLTFEVREGIVKHSRDLTPGESPILDEYLPDLRPPIEAQIIDLADEIAYNAADLDDAHDAAMLAPEQIAEAVPAYAEILESVETSYPGATVREQFQETLRHLIDGLVSGLIDGTVASAKAAGVTDVDSVRHCSQRVVRFTDESGATSRHLKRFLQQRVYHSPALADDRARSMDRLSRLFAHLMEHPELLPGGDAAERAGGEPLHRLVCDYIAGMTDGYFERVYTAVLG